MPHKDDLGKNLEGRKLRCD